MTQSSRRRGRKDSLAQVAQPETNPPIWPGVRAGRFNPLSAAEVARVETAAITLLETLGLSQASPSMVAKVTDAGGRLTEDGHLLFPPDLVQ